MSTFAFRPRAEALEDRANPVSPAEVATAFATTATNQQLLEFFTDNPGTYTVVTNAPSTKATAQAIVSQSQTAVAALDQFMADLAAQIQANPAAAGTLQVALNGAAHERIEALTNQGTAQLLITFIDVTNQINSQAQRALSTALQLGVITTDPNAPIQTIQQFQQSITNAQATTVPGVTAGTGTTNTNGASATAGGSSTTGTTTGSTTGTGTTGSNTFTIPNTTGTGTSTSTGTTTGTTTGATGTTTTGQGTTNSTNPTGTSTTTI